MNNKPEKEPFPVKELINEITELKCERDEARKFSVELTEKYLEASEQLQRERDELREALAELEEYRSIAENVGAKKAVSEKEKAIQERDELRYVLHEIANASHFDNIGNWARNKAQKALEITK